MPPTTTRHRTATRARRSANERAILDSIEGLLVDRTFHDLTVEDVMASTGLTRTAFYRYFPDLETVLLRRLSEVTVEIRAAADRWLDDAADPEASLLESALAMARVYEEHGRLLLAYADAATTGDRVGETWRQTVESFIDLCARRMRSLGRPASGDLDDDVDIDQTARALVGMIERYLLDTYGRRRDVPVAVEVAAATITLIWRRTLFGR